LKSALNTVLIANHAEHSGQPDTIGFGCAAGDTCYKVSPVSYKVARQHLFGDIHLSGTDKSNYSIELFYCAEGDHSQISNSDLPKDEIGPLLIPDPNIVNAEHTWPQSKFSGGFSKDVQKADLHILLPISSHVNSVRGNYPYGEVVTPINSPCADAALGKSASGTTVFEPTDSSKGNVARAIFYFSVRYKSKIDPEQEEVLKRWNKMDPPDSEESRRNDAVFAIQKDRNPFIDAPELADDISDF
jgi:hypothetical protein